MNYLGHAFLSFGNAELLVGNMLGDSVKGLIAVQEYPKGIQRGIMLHRKIDEFTDNDPAVQRAQVWFRQEYGLYSGPIVDVLFDHYVATDPVNFKTESELLSFSHDVYKKLEIYKEYFPPKFAAMFPYMREQNWLYNYRTIGGAKRSLQGLQNKATQMKAIDDACESFVINYYQLGQCYYEFIERVCKFVNNELKENNS